ncbi:MAG: hypothetical protein Crog4KO_12860 [Crocinitomicaceae bacterium]
MDKDITRTNQLRKSRSVEYGIRMFLATGLLFLSLYILGLAEFAELRFFNLAVILYFSFKLGQMNVERFGGKSYVRNLGSIFAANSINVILSMFGLLLFDAAVGFTFLDSASRGILMVESASVPQTMIALFLEGMAGAAVVSFITMQFWKGKKVKTIEDESVS